MATPLPKSEQCQLENKCGSARKRRCLARIKVARAGCEDGDGWEEEEEDSLRLDQIETAEAGHGKCGLWSACSSGLLEVRATFLIKPETLAH